MHSYSPPPPPPRHPLQLAAYEQKIAELQASLSLAQSQGARLREKEAELRRIKDMLERRNSELDEAMLKLKVRLVCLFVCLFA